MNSRIITSKLPPKQNDSFLPNLTNFLNSYEIVNKLLEWDVSIYILKRTDGKPQSNDDRSELKSVLWNLRRKYSSSCRGYGFVIDIDEKNVAVPSNWDIPTGIQEGQYIVVQREIIKTRPADTKSQPIISGIIREGLKQHFKNNSSDTLGDLWQNYNSFCQKPIHENSDRYCFCRSFDIKAKLLHEKKWVLEFIIGTVTIDGKTFQEYYLCGDVSSLVDMIEAKKMNKLSRDNRPVSVRLLRIEESAHRYPRISVLNLSDEDILKTHATLSYDKQRSHHKGIISCQPFKKNPIHVPLEQIRLILDTQITQETHSETIIEPADRHCLSNDLRDFLDGAEVYGTKLKLSKSPSSADNFPHFFVKPPSVRVKDENNTETIIRAPSEVTADALRKRSRIRQKQVRRYGFLEQRPIKPLLACPKTFGKERARRLKNDLNFIMRKSGIKFMFERWLLYDHVINIRKEIENKGYDTLLAVLPEGSNKPQYPNDTHEHIKQRIDVPSQCIHHDNTLPETWASKPPSEFNRAKPRWAGQIRNRYENCISNLLVKHNWIPFTPIDPFHYNVQIGLDVGGRHNNKVMACIGSGFHHPDRGLVFRPEEIPIDLTKAEPIPTQYLYGGLISLFEFIDDEIKAAGGTPDFNHTLFFRDGKFLGRGDGWNEIDALIQLHEELLNRKWITKDSIWTAIEIQKRAEGWRIFRNNEDSITDNPMVGYCVLPFEDDTQGLICTTGQPYLTQGTASPIKFNILDIYGKSKREEVVQDLVWSADMCFTKIDISGSLPWVLKVADSGALQLSRSHHISGITT